jgi:glycosyltransferase involved in cell wall biosynthesis
MTQDKKILIIHNIMWSAYKGEILGDVSGLAERDGVCLRVAHIARTERSRVKLGEVDFSKHPYNYILMFDGCYEDIGPFRIFGRFVRLVYGEKYSLIVLPGYHRLEHWLMLFFVLLSKKKIGLFCDSTALDRPKSFLKTWLKKFFFSSCDVIFTYGSMGEKYVRDHLLTSTSVIPGCQAASLPYKCSPDDILLLKNKKSKNVTNLLYVGRLSSEKGLDLLINSYMSSARLKAETTLTIVGDGPDKVILEKLVDYCGDNCNIYFVGSKSGFDLYDYYIKSDVLVLPSKSEPWGLVVNEALHYGCACVVSDRCGCWPELIVSKKTGETFVSESSSSLVEKILLIVDGRKKGFYLPEECIKHAGFYSVNNAAKKLYNGITSA